MLNVCYLVGIVNQLPYCKSGNMNSVLWQWPISFITDELDSYMYQTVGHHGIELYAEAMGLPLYREIISGTSVNQGRIYRPTENDEVEDLFRLLSRVKV